MYPSILPLISQVHPVTTNLKWGNLYIPWQGLYSCFCWENVKKYSDFEIGDISEKVRTYARNNNLTKETLFLYAGNFNNSVYKTIIEMGI